MTSHLYFALVDPWNPKAEAPAAVFRASDPLAPPFEVWKGSWVEEAALVDYVTGRESGRVAITESAAKKLLPEKAFA